LPETRDRIMATTVEARWGTTEADLDHTALAATVPATFSAAFATHDASESLQHTLHTMGSAVLDAIRAIAHPWERIEVDGVPHSHGFRPAAGGSSVTTLTQERGMPPTVTGGIQGLRLLKTTGSAFSGYPTDAYTTLPETRDRIMATTVEARWGTIEADLDHTALAATVPTTFSAAFARHDASESLQHTLHTMGSAVLDAHPEVTWIRFRMPNEHHNLADLSPYGLDNPNMVYVVAGDPSGLIEGVVTREGVEPPPAW